MKQAGDILTAAASSDVVPANSAGRMGAFAAKLPHLSLIWLVRVIGSALTRKRLGESRKFGCDSEDTDAPPCRNSFHQR